MGITGVNIPAVHGIKHVVYVFPHGKAIVPFLPQRIRNAGDQILGFPQGPGCQLPDVITQCQRNPSCMYSFSFVTVFSWKKSPNAESVSLHSGRAADGRSIPHFPENWGQRLYPICQISSAYCRMVRSLENLPALAMFISERRAAAFSSCRSRMARSLAST